MGQIALEIKQTQGTEAIKGLVEAVKERHGLTLSWKTLLNYAWIEEKTKDLAIPDDISFKTRQAIAGAEDPQKYVDLILQGVSSGEIYRMIRGEPEKKEIACPSCGFKFIPINAKDKKEKGN